MRKIGRIIVNVDMLMEEINKGKTSISGKLQVERVISKEIIRSSMMKTWKITNPCSVLDIQQYTFIFSFDSEEGMNWVMARRPWLFASSLLSL